MSMTLWKFRCLVGMKPRHRKSGLAQKVGRVITPVTSCLGRQTPQYQHQRVTSETVTISVHRDMVASLMAMFGGQEESSHHVGK